MYKAPPAHALTEEFYETDAFAATSHEASPFRPSARSPSPFAKQMMASKGAVGLGHAARA